MKLKCLLSLFVLCGAAFARQPNIVFILSDDHRADLLEFAGHPIIKTPRLNEMAENGMYFPNAYPNSPLCSPSRASFFSGKYCERTGAPRIVECASGFLELEKLFPEYLHDAGYKTGFVGKWHLGEGREPNKRGFDYWAGWNWVGGDFDFTITENGTDVRMSGFTDDYTSSLAAGFIKKHAEDDEPFFLYLGLKAPHMPLAYPPRLEHAFDGIEIPKPVSYDEDYAVTGKRGLVGSGIGVESSRFAIQNFGDWENYSKSYYRAALSIDGSVGTVLDALREAGIEKNTLLIYSSDHGYHVGEHGLTEKHYTYRHSMKIPMVMQYPALIEPGSVSDALVMGMDLGPTLLNLCGIAVPEEMDGKSWLPVLKNGGEGEVHEDIFSALNSADTTKIFRTNLCVENHKYKLIWFPTLDHYELYDTLNDVEEMHNLANDSDYAEILSAMKSRLDQKCRDAEWSQMVYSSHLPTDFFVLGPVDKADEPAVRKAIFSKPSIDYTKPLNVSGNVYKWNRISSRSQASLNRVFENRKGAFGYIAFPVENLQSSTGFLQISMTDNKLPLAGLWDDRVLYVNRIGAEPFNYRHSGLPWFFQYCPPLKPGMNDVVMGFEAQGERVPLHFPATVMYMDKALKFPLFHELNDAAGRIPLSFHRTKIKDLERRDVEDGSVQFKTTGKMPLVWLMNQKKKYDHNVFSRIEFEYKSESGLPFLRVLFGPTLSLKNSVTRSNLPPVSEWTACSVDLSESANYTQSAPFFRFDFGTLEGRDITIRNVTLKKK